MGATLSLRCAREISNVPTTRVHANLEPVLMRSMKRSSPQGLVSVMQAVNVKVGRRRAVVGGLVGVAACDARALDGLKGAGSGERLITARKYAAPARTTWRARARGPARRAARAPFARVFALAPAGEGHEREERRDGARRRGAPGGGGARAHTRTPSLVEVSQNFVEVWLTF